MSFLIALENLTFSINPISWLDYLHGIAEHGKLSRLEWRDATGQVVENTLRRYAIHGYGRGIAAELETSATGEQRKSYRRWVWVNAEQASWAEYLLLRAGVALTSVIDPNNIAWAQQHSGEAQPAPWMGGKRAKASTPVEGLFDLFSMDDDETPGRRNRRQRRGRR